MRFPDLKTGIVMSPECQHFIMKLLDKNPRKRLGAKGAKQVLTHPWIEEIDYEKIEDKTICPPFKPALNKDDPLDVSNFDPVFTSEKAEHHTLSPQKKRFIK